MTPLSTSELIDVYGLPLHFRPPAPAARSNGAYRQSATKRRALFRESLLRFFLVERILRREENARENAPLPFGPKRTRLLTGLRLATDLSEPSACMLRQLLARSEILPQSASGEPRSPAGLATLADVFEWHAQHPARRRSAPKPRPGRRRARGGVKQIAIQRASRKGAR